MEGARRGPPWRARQAKKAEEDGAAGRSSPHHYNGGMTPLVPGRLRAVLFDAGNTLVRMNYGAIAGHLQERGHAVLVDAVEEAELRARVRLDADLARGVSTEGRTAQDLYLVYLLDGLGITDAREIEAAADFRRVYNAPAGLFNVADPGALRAIRQVKAAGPVAGVRAHAHRPPPPPPPGARAVGARRPLLPLSLRA